MGKLSGKPGPDPGQRNAGAFAKAPLTIARLGEPKSHGTRSNPGRNAKMQPLDGSRPCGECGQWHKRCRGHRANTNRSVPCGLQPTNGTGLCFKHGGRVTATVAAAKRRTLKAEGIRGLNELGIIVRDSTTVDSLRALIDRWDGLAAARWADVCALDSLYIVETDKWGGRHTVVHPAYGLHVQALDRLTNILIQCAKLGLEDKRLELAKEQGDRLFDAFTTACRAAELTDAQVDTMRLALVAAFRPAELAA